MSQRQSILAASRPRLFVLATLAAILLTTAVELIADEPAPSNQATPDSEGASVAPLFRFRRVFAPADRIGNWPNGHVKYIPIEATEFERLIKLTQDTEAVSELGSAQLVVAHYEAQLNDDDLLVGKFNWQVTHASAESALLGLDPCNLPIHEALWDDGGEAILGNGPEGRLGLLVERAGQLHGTWSMRGQRSAAGSVSFVLDLPSCVCARLTCDLPKGMTAAADHGVSVQIPGAPTGFRRWQLELGGQSRIRFRALAEGAANERRQLTLLREALTYEFTKRGVDVSAQLRLDIHNEPLQRIHVRLDPGLKLLAARYGDLDIPWSVVPEPRAPRPPDKKPADKPTTAKPPADKPLPAGKTTDKPPVDPGTRIALDFPEPLLGTGRVLQLSAQAPLSLGERQRLPGIRPEDMFWQEGTATLVVPRPLVLEQIATQGCRQSKTAPLAAPSGGETVEVQYFGSDAAIDVDVDQPDQRFQVDCGTLVELGAAEMMGHAMLRLQLAQGERFVVRAEVGHQWLIDSVESDAENIADWGLVPSDDKSTQLVIRLKHAVTSRRPAQIYLKGHRATNLGEKIPGSQLTMIRFRGHSGIQLISVRAPESYDLQTLHADELNRRDPGRLSAAETAVFPEPPAGLVFAVDAGSARLNLWLADRKPSYAGEIAIDVAAQGKSLHQTFTLRCTPQGSRVDRLLVNFSHAGKQALHWSLVGGNSGQLTARRLTEDNEAAHGAGGESWEVTLRLPRPGPFEVRATRSVPLTNHLPVMLAALPEATSQQGTLLIRAVGETGLVIHNRRLKPTPAELLSPEKYQTVRAAFRYEPSRDMTSEPALTLSPAASWQETCGAWAWKTTLDSRYGSSGTANHMATYQVQTVGRQSVRCELPQGATLRGAWLDERPLAVTSLGDLRKPIRLDLPSGRSFVTLVLHFTTEESLPALIRSTAAPVPRLDIPELERRWLVWTPPGYGLFDADPRWLVQPTQHLTWSQRLFGPLGRPASQQRFDPFSSEHWRELAGDLQPGGIRPAAEQRLLDAIAALGSVEPAASENLSHARRRAWGPLLMRWKSIEATSGLLLLADLQSLAGLGFDAESIVHPSLGDNDLSRGISLLAQSNLMLLVHENTVLLTSASGAARVRNQLLPLNSGVACAVVNNGTLADELVTATDGSHAQFINLDAWIAGVPCDRIPWTLAAVSRDDLSGSRGWNAVWLELPDGAAPSMHLVRTAGMQAFGWAMCLTILGLGGWVGSRRAAPWIIAASGLGGLALVAPAAWTLLLAPSLLAVLVYLTLLLTGRLSLLLVPVAVAAVPGRRLMQPQPLLLLAFAISAAAQGISARAVEPKPEPAPRAASAAHADPAFPTAQTSAINHPADAVKNPSPPAGADYTVFVPVNADRQPTGGKYFIPLEMFSRLYRAAATALNQPDGWLISQAIYRGSLARDTVQRRLVVNELKGIFDLQVFESNVQIKIPLDREGVTLSAEEARLDGRPLHHEWDAATGAMLLQVPDRGHYRLEINLQPGPQALVGHSGFDLVIPPLNQASVELTVPADGPRVDLPNARGIVSTSRDRTMLTGQLGPTGRLAVRWSDGAGVDGMATNLDVEELFWVSIRPGSLVVDTRLKLRVLEGRVRQVRLLADPRLRLLPTAGADALIAEVHSVPGEPQVIDLELSRPIVDQATLDLSFLLTGTSGVGNLRLPRLEVSGARATRRWMAVSVDPSLQFKEQPGGDSRPLAVPDFAAAWGLGESRPNAAYSVPRGDLPLVIATEPRESRTTAEQVLSVSVEQGQLALRCDATLQTTAGYNFQLLLNGPKNLQVESVSLLGDGVQHVTRWSQDNAGRITVFLDGAVSGLQQLSLVGTLPAPTTSRVALPQLSIESAESKKSLVYIYRSPAMLVDVEGVHDLAPMANEVSSSARGDLGSAVASFLTRGPNPKAMLRLRPNGPTTHGVLAITVQRENDVWSADADLQLHVANGFVDTIRLDVPLQWQEPYQLDPPLAHEVLTIPGENRRQLLIRPATPVKDHLHVRVRGRLGLAGGERLRVPDISAGWIGKLERFVVLPSQLELQQVEWETVGLRAAKLPVDFQRPVPAPETFTAYQVIGDHFQAALKSVERMAGVPQVRLADIQIAWRADGACYGTAAFDVEPAGVATCMLHVPGRFRMIHATVTGLPAVLEPAGQDRWRVSLASPQLPQHVEVLFQGQLPAGSWGPSRWRMEAPEIVDLEVERTLWTIYAPSPAGVGQPLVAQASSTDAQQESWRAKNIAAMLNLAADAAADQLPEEIVRWYRPWQGRFERSRAVIRRDYLAAAAGRPAREENEAQALEQEQGNVLKRLGVAGLVKSRKYRAFSDEASELFTAQHTGQRPTSCMFRGGVRPIDVHYARALTGDFGLRILAAFSLLAAGIAGAWLLGRIHWTTRSPAFGAMLVGLLWWLVLNPSALGFAVFCIGAATMLRRLWRERRLTLAKAV